MATFSAIVPVHNGEKTLRRCVESLVPQVSRILLIENGSKDRSRQLCHVLAEEFPNVTALDGDAVGGVSKARNLGLRYAETPYILFCDCDDYVEPDYAEHFRKALEHADFAICGYVNHDEVANGRTDIYGFSEGKTVELLPRLEEIHSQCLLQQLWNKVFSRDVIEKAGIRFDESISIGEDMRFVLDYLAAARPRKTALLAKPLYHYMRDQPGSLMYRMGTEKMDEAIRNLDTMYRLMDLPGDVIEEKIAREREHQKDLYAYLIMHNMGMPLRQRRKLILALDESQGRRLYRYNLWLFAKEKMRANVRKTIKAIPLWIKSPISILLTESGRWPINIVLAHMRRSFAQCGGCGEKGKLRAERAVQKVTYRWVQRRYGYVIENSSLKYTAGSPVENAPVWVFWWQGERSAPEIVQRCIASVKKAAGNHPVRVIDQWNYRQFVTVPDYIEKKRDEGKISLTHFSDYLRMALLANHGGLWLDATIYVSADLRPAFREPIFTVRNPRLDDTNISNWNWSGFALGCQKQFALPCMMIDLFDAYWKDQDRLIEYFLIDYMVRMVYDNSELVRKCINDIPCNNSGLYFYQENFNLAAEGKSAPEDTWLYKLSWKGQYRTHTEEDLETVYGQWLKETGEMLCQK